jgi:hypothetical protein
MIYLHAFLNGIGSFMLRVLNMFIFCEVSNMSYRRNYIVIIELHIYCEPETEIKYSDSHTHGLLFRNCVWECYFC